MWADISPEELQEALDRVASEVLWEAEIVCPPVDAFLLATRLGLVIASDEPLCGRGETVRFDGPVSGAVMIAPEVRPERRQWVVAHEVGEFVAHRAFDYLGLGPAATSFGAREMLANRLASCLLLPRRWLMADGPELDWDLQELKARYSTASHELIARRMLELASSVAVTLFDQGKLVWRRGSPGAAVGPLLQEEQACWRLAHQTGQRAEIEGRMADGRLVRTRCWAIREPGRTREIMRTEWGEFW